MYLKIFLIACGGLAIYKLFTKCPMTLNYHFNYVYNTISYCKHNPIMSPYRKEVKLLCQESIVIVGD